MKFRIVSIVLVPALVVSAAAGAQCFGRMVEQERPPAVLGLTPDDPGLIVRYWAWDDFNHRRGGTAQPTLEQSNDGILLAELNWLDADVCLNSGPVVRTTVLFEALGADGFGRWALVNLRANSGTDVDVDLAQAAMNPSSSRAVPVPHPRVVTTVMHKDVVEIRLDWTVDHRGEILSDLEANHWQPSSIRGFALYVINGPNPTPRPWDWTRGRDVEPDAVNGYSTNTRATLMLPRSLWHDVDVCFAVALTFDGNGDADGEFPRSRSVHGEYLGAPSRWLSLPPDDGSIVAGESDGLRRRSRSGQIDLERAPRNDSTCR